MVAAPRIDGRLNRVASDAAAVECQGCASRKQTIETAVEEYPQIRAAVAWPGGIAEGSGLISSATDIPEITGIA